MKKENLHVAIFPIGTVMKFSKNLIKRSDGTAEYYKMVWALARQKSITRISIIQKSDWYKISEEEKMEIDPRGVIFDVYTELNLKIANNVNNKSQPEVAKYLWEALKNLPQPDFGIGFPGQGFTLANIPNFLPQLRDPSKTCAALNMTVAYSSQIIHWINMSNVKWYWIATDPRYCTKTLKRRDLVNLPIEILAQYNDIIEIYGLDEYDPKAKESWKKVNVIYSGVEKTNIIAENIVNPINERTNKFSIVAMQSSYGKGENINKDYRYNALKKWVLSYDKDNEASIYGKWAEPFTKGIPQFKGFIHHNEIDNLFKNTRYTLVIPIMPHWVTSKYAEMLSVGVLPFLHPEYDTQYNILPKDHYIRVKSPKEMYEKMEYLDNNPELRIKLVKSLQYKLLNGVRNGSFLIETLNKANKRNNIDIHIPFEYDDTQLREPKIKNKPLF